jgi:hypothetical protein
MQLTLRYTPEIYDLLLKHVPPASDAYKALERATLINSRDLLDTDAYWFECSEQDADVLVQTAYKNFSNRAREVEDPIKNHPR